MLLYGGSGHAKVIIDCLLANNLPVHGIFDDNPALTSLVDYPVVGSYKKDFLPQERILIAIGNNYIRNKLANTIMHTFGMVIHPSAQVSRFASLGPGTVIFHNSVVQAGTNIGTHCIINTAASIDHDCIISDFVHISPNATVSGGVQVGEGTHIGAGATIIQGIRLGKWCTIGAGAVVIRNVPDFATAVGVPAKIIRTTS
jgi:sugar O-acyltransferase (sialic acid O-acetyltransferase NeuD family)